MKDYYAILGISPEAEDIVIRAAYKAMSQKYHPDKFSGEPAEANAKMADINEANDVLSDPRKRKAYNAERTETDYGDKTNDEEDYLGPNLQVPELPRMGKREFQCLTTISKPVISSSIVRTLFSDKFISAKTKFPKGVTVDSIANSTCLIYVPAWLIKGNASGEWRATGITIDVREVNCNKCGGRGTIGNGKNRRGCSMCHGSGQINRRNTKKTPEKGFTEGLVKEFVVSKFPSIQFDLDFSLETAPIEASSHMISGLYCLQPEHDYTEIKEILNERLESELKNNVRKDLRNYDDIEGLHFDSSSVVFSSKEITFWLYPVYVCWYEKKGRKQFAVCDGISGKVVLPKNNGIWNFFKKLFKYVVIGGVAFITIILLLPANKTPDGQESPEAAPKPVVSQSNNIVQKDVGSTKKQQVPSDEMAHATKQDAVVDEKEPEASSTNEQVDDTNSNTTEMVAHESIENPSFDCNKANTAVENMICSSKELAEDDRKMAEAFELKKQSIPFGIFKKQVKQDQADWIEHVRNACTDESCLIDAYKKRIEILSHSNQPEKPAICPIPGHC